MDLDDTDKKILNELIRDARQSYREIAKSVQRSVVTVMDRVRTLQKEGIISHFSASLDYSKLGFDLQVIIKARVKHGKELDVTKKYINNANITSIYDVTGDFDVVMIGKFRNRGSLDNFVKKLQSQEFIERTETVLILNLIKEGQVYPLV